MNCRKVAGEITCTGSQTATRLLRVTYLRSQLIRLCQAGRSGRKIVVRSVQARLTGDSAYGPGEDSASE
jgi:hypothetical protein